MLLDGNVRCNKRLEILTLDSDMATVMLCRLHSRRCFALFTEVILCASRVIGMLCFFVSNETAYMVNVHLKYKRQS